MSVEDIKKNLNERMTKAIHTLEKEFNKIRAGRANPNILEDVKIDYYGSPTSVLQVANVSVPEPQMIVVSPWEKSMLAPIEKALLKADIGITPQNDGNVIRLPIPPLNQERRKELVKSAKKVVEESKIAIRNVRRDAMNDLKKLESDKLISQDDHKKESANIQKLTDDYTNKASAIYSSKEKQLLED